MAIDSIRGRKILVTGGAGFIGSFLVERLVQLQGQVTVLDNLSTGNLVNLHLVKDQIEFIHADLSPSSLEQVLSDHHFDIIFHLAGNSYVPPSVEDPMFDYKSNLETTVTLLHALSQHRLSPVFIYASSAGVYGNPRIQPISEEHPLVPISPYGVSKLAAEQYVTIWAKLYGMRTASLRIFSTYGPRQRKQVIFDLIDRLFNHSDVLEILGDGSQTRDFAYVEDQVEGFLAVLRHAPFQGEVYNVASGRECSILELAEMLCQLLRIKRSFKFSGRIRPGDPERWRADISKLRAMGFEPRVSLEVGLQRTLDWYRKNYVRQ